MFRVMRNSGFHIQFSNGFLISCQFDCCSYCSKRTFENFENVLQKEKQNYSNFSKDCEVAIIKDGEFITGEIVEEMNEKFSLDLPYGDGQVLGYVNADTVAKIISYISTK